MPMAPRPITPTLWISLLIAPTGSGSVRSFLLQQAASQFAALALPEVPVGGAYPAHRVFHVRCGRLARPRRVARCDGVHDSFVLDLHLARKVGPACLVGTGNAHRLANLFG